MRKRIEGEKFMLKTKVGYSTQKDSFTKGVETAKKAKLNETKTRITLYFMSR